MRDFEWADLLRRGGLCDCDSDQSGVTEVSCMTNGAAQVDNSLDILRSPERRVSVIILVRNISKGRQVL